MRLQQPNTFYKKELKEHYSEMISDLTYEIVSYPKDNNFYKRGTFY